MMLYKLLDQSKPNILLYGLTPPKITHTKEEIKEIASRQLERLKSAPIDGIVMYDLQDEAQRTAQERPFPFLETLDPEEYVKTYMSEYAQNCIIYRAVGKHEKDQMQTWLEERNSNQIMRVFVGAASQNQSVKLRLQDAYLLKKNHAPNMQLGGIAIAERHMKKGNEDQRMVEKISQGCSFFITQAVYDYDAAAKFLNDYAAKCKENSITPVSIIFTLTPCGSAKTLEFMKWLGIHIPENIQDELLSAHNMLDASILHIVEAFKKLFVLGGELGVPIGCNVESVAIRKSEIEASIDLTHIIRRIMSGE